MANSEVGEPSMPTDGRLRWVRHQRVFVVDDRDGAMRMLDQPGADRTK